MNRDHVLDERAERLVDQEEPVTLAAALRLAPPLDARRAQTLDHVLRQWTARQLSRRTDADGLLELDELIFLALEGLPSELPDAGRIQARWAAFRDLLESSRLASVHRDGTRARGLHHAGAVLDLLTDGPLSQSEFSGRLGVSAARVSQVLGVMEEGGLIRRFRKGRENLVEACEGPEGGQPFRPMSLLSSSRESAAA